MLRKLSLALLLSVSIPSFAQEWRKDLPEAKVAGSGEFTWWGLSIYSARLWHAGSNFDTTQDFALEITYNKSISRTRFVDASIDEMKRIMGTKLTPGLEQQWRAYMEKSFVDVKPGDQLIGVKLRGKGCRFYSRDRLISEIADEDFAQAFFAIWLDPRSRDQELRSRILGMKK
ncbi:chalcone isomerase family protein [Undibacterium cyanobacteriorum]|uniref:Chalcone isomerase family protein n=1 Tax=Undibacterium cyanobacteriorum TaxID=3073561 RepID=A0ABY9RNW7_9BURK|nr:chalcone isomerase family protein [Undibacterium sp. 20NA77.5]WMW82474.1 chalcone isomerase family protein [Undibacterium sp. 20NA77.5]